MSWVIAAPRGGPRRRSVRSCARTSARARCGWSSPAPSRRSADELADAEGCPARRRPASLAAHGAPRAVPGGPVGTACAGRLAPGPRRGSRGLRPGGGPRRATGRAGRAGRRARPARAALPSARRSDGGEARGRRGRAAAAAALDVRADHPRRSRSRAAARDRRGHLLRARAPERLGRLPRPPCVAPDGDARRADRRAPLGDVPDREPASREPLVLRGGRRRRRLRRRGGRRRRGRASRQHALDARPRRRAAGRRARLGPALLAAAPPDTRLHTPYRIIGDPLALLVGTAEGARRAARVFAPAPDLAA